VPTRMIGVEETLRRTLWPEAEFAKALQGRLTVPS
jgi:hypothetical protein